MLYNILTCSSCVVLVCGVLVAVMLVGIFKSGANHRTGFNYQVSSFTCGREEERRHGEGHSVESTEAPRSRQCSDHSWPRGEK